MTRSTPNATLIPFVTGLVAGRGERVARSGDGALKATPIAAQAISGHCSKDPTSTRSRFLRGSPAVRSERHAWSLA